MFQDPSAGLITKFKPQRRLRGTTASAALILLIAAAFLALFGEPSEEWLRGVDFPAFYCGARMVIDGHGRQMYDVALQYSYQARYAGRIGTLYNHPPFEVATYLAVSWLPLRHAYTFWVFLNLVLLGLAARTVGRGLGPPCSWRWPVLLAGSFLFVPVLLCLWQGQDSIVLLLLVCLGFAALGRGQGFVSGCWLGLGLFKFHIVLPIALVLAIALRWRGDKNGRGFLSGFVVVAVGLALLSAGISGWSVFRTYPEFLFHLHEQPFEGISPLAMPNFRGLVALFSTADGSSVVRAAITAVLSVAALGVSLYAWRARIGESDARGHFDSAFAATVTFAMLASYHFNPHDLALLLLPMLLLSCEIFRSDTEFRLIPRWIAWTSLIVTFLPPVAVFALRIHRFALLSIPVMVWFAVGAYLTTKVGVETAPAGIS